MPPRETVHVLGVHRRSTIQRHLYSVPHISFQKNSVPHIIHRAASLQPDNHVIRNEIKQPEPPAPRPIPMAALPLARSPHPAAALPAPRVSQFAPPLRPLRSPRCRHRFRLRFPGAAAAAVAASSPPEAQAAPAAEQEKRRKLYVANLPWSLPAPELEELFAQCGTVKDVEVRARPPDSTKRNAACTGEPLRRAFEFSNCDSAF